MPMLTNSRHERFAQGLAQGKTADEAYKRAGYKENRCNASRLKTNEHISSRVAELQERVVEGVILTREWVIERLIENVNRAMELKDGTIANGSVANRALELLGKELGMFVEHSENRNVNYIVSPEMPPEEWEAKYCEPRPPLDS